MIIDHLTKTITLTDTDISHEYQTKKLYEIQYKHVKQSVQRELRVCIMDMKYRVVYAYKNKRILMIYNK